jgi:hypothetical protein
MDTNLEWIRNFIFGDKDNEPVVTYVPIVSKVDNHFDKVQKTIDDLTVENLELKKIEKLYEYHTDSLYIASQKVISEKNLIIENIMAENESLRNLARFLSKYQDELNQVRFKLIKQKGNIKELEYIFSLQWPVVQGFQNQNDLKKIGDQEIRHEEVGKAVRILLKGIKEER